MTGERARTGNPARGRFARCAGPPRSPGMGATLIDAPSPMRAVAAMDAIG